MLWWKFLCRMFPLSNERDCLWCTATAVRVASYQRMGSRNMPLTIVARVGYGRTAEDNADAVRVKDTIVLRAVYVFGFGQVASVGCSNKGGHARFAEIGHSRIR